LCRDHRTQPIFFWRWFAGSNDFHLITVLEGMTEGHEFMVHFGADTGRTDVRMYLKCEIQCRRAIWQLYERSFWGKDKYLVREQVHLEIVQKVQRVLLWITKYFPHFLDPLV